MGVGDDYVIIRTGLIRKVFLPDTAVAVPLNANSDVESNRDS